MLGLCINGLLLALSDTLSDSVSDTGGLAAQLAEMDSSVTSHLGPFLHSAAWEVETSSGDLESLWIRILRIKQAPLFCV